MEKLPQRQAGKRDKPKLGRMAYVSPAIIYEGKVTIRAGSPPSAGDPPFGGPPSPFSSPGG